jgi:hypothetical protein
MIMLYSLATYAHNPNKVGLSKMINTMLSPIPGFPRRRPDIVSQSVPRETLLYDPVADAVHVLNQTASVVWELCDGQHDLSDMAAYLRKHFTVAGDDDVIEDVQAVVEIFSKEKLLSSG